MCILYIVYIMYVGIHKYRYIHIYVCFLYTCIYAFHKKERNEPSLRNHPIAFNCISYGY